MVFHDNQEEGRDVCLRCREGKRVLSPGIIELAKDFILPDAYGDAKRILSVATTLSPKGCYTEEGKAHYSGELVCKVLFVSDEGKVCAVPFTMEYEDAVTLGDPEGFFRTLCMPRVLGTYARLVNPRKIGLKAKLEPSLFAWEEREGSVAFPDNLTSEELESFEELTEEMTYCTWVCETANGMESGDDILFDEPEAPIGQILYTDIDFSRVNAEAREGAVAISGKADVTLVYEKDNEQKEVAFRRHSVELSSMVEAEGVKEKNDVFATIYCETLSCVAAEDAAGERRVAELDFTYGASLAIRKEETYLAVKDLYSTQYQCKNTEAALPYSGLLGKEKLAFTLSAETSFKEEGNVVGSVLEVRELSLDTKDGETVLSGTLHGRVIIREVDGSVVAQPIDLPIVQKVSIPYSKEGEALLLPMPEKPKVVLQDGVIKLEVPMTVSVMAWETRWETVVAKTAVTAKYDTDAEGTFTVYFPSSEEGVWEIAKKFHVPRSCLVMSGSEKGKGASARRALIIPRKKKAVFSGVIN